MALRTAVVIVSGAHGEEELNALLDEASTRTYIEPDVARRLMLTVKNERGDVTLLGGNKLDLNEVVELTITLHCLNLMIEGAGRLRFFRWWIFICDVWPTVSFSY